MKKIINIFFFILFLFSISSCKWNNDDLTSPGTSNNPSLYSYHIVSEIKLDESIKRSLRKNDTKKNVYLGYYSQNGDFVKINNTNTEINGSKILIRFDTEPEKTKNLIIRVVDNNNQILGESILSLLKTGMNQAERIVNNKNNKVQIIKTLASMNLTDKYSIGDILCILTPNKLNILNDKDIDTLTRTIIGLYSKELKVLDNTLITETDIEIIREKGFELSQNIIKGIEKGKYISIDNAWKMYSARLNKYALSYLKDKPNVHSCANRRSPALSATDIFNEYDVLYRSFRSSIVKLELDVQDGNIEMFDFQTGNIRDVTVAEGETVSEVMGRVIQDQQIYTKPDFVMSESIKFLNRLEIANQTFGHNIDLTSLNSITDNFLMEYQKNDISSQEQADAYVYVRESEIKNNVSSKFSELMFKEAGDDINSVRVLNTYTPKIMLGVLRDLNKALNPSHVQYDYKIADIFSYSDYSAEEDHTYLTYSYYYITDYLNSTDKGIKEKVLEVLYFEDFLSDRINHYISIYLPETNFSWTSDEIDIIARLFSSIIALRIERPIEVMDNQGVYYELSGSLNKTTNNIGSEYYYYTIEDSLTRDILAYVKIIDDGSKESDFFTLTNNNPYYTGIDTVIHLDTETGEDIYSSLSDFQNIYLSQQDWYFKYYENYNVAFAEPVNTIDYDTILGNHLRFKGIVYPPYGTYSGDDMIDISKYSTDALIFEACDFDTEEIELGPYLNEEVDEVFCKIVWDDQNLAYYVVNSTYNPGENIVCPNLDPNEEYAIYTYWKLDYSSAITFDRYTGTPKAWDPDDFDLQNDIFRITGLLNQRQVFDNIEEKTLSASIIRLEEEAAEEFYITGILTDYEKVGSYYYGHFYTESENGSLLLTFRSIDYFYNDEINQWFSENIGKTITVGDPDPTDDYDGLTYSITTATWDDTTGAYYLDAGILNYYTTNGKPDWAKIEGWSVSVSGQVYSVTKQWFSNDYIVKITDPTNWNSTVLEITINSSYSNTLQWFQDSIGEMVTVGDPDTEDYTDGITMPVDDFHWYYSYYTLDITNKYENAFSNGKPDWAKID